MNQKVKKGLKEEKKSIYQLVSRQFCLAHSGSLGEMHLTEFLDGGFFGEGVIYYFRVFNTMIK